MWAKRGWLQNYTAHKGRQQYPSRTYQHHIPLSIGSTSSKSSLTFGHKLRNTSTFIDLLLFLTSSSADCHGEGSKGGIQGGYFGPAFVGARHMTCLQLSEASVSQMYTHIVCQERSSYAPSATELFSRADGWVLSDLSNCAPVLE